jgi:hypothetical protein
MHYMIYSLWRKVRGSSIATRQAAYNITCQIELESGDVCTLKEHVLSPYTMDIKVAKQCYGVDGELVLNNWFEGSLRC